ncbi:MAG: UDP-N-acetylmuramoyl-L-alanyl-D-glutamate--2,6-diaminopimelate ligase [Planctomycetes bacterium]|nr:UDP-N-acetylmuramoyl-L-alanyl-D-glutamate--2,6-diaminopimelate ligase [Planctomycetota bacterium]
MVRLSELARRHGGTLRDASTDPDVHDVELDSRRVRAHTLFAALPGQRADGARFVADARARGACAVLCAEAPAEAGLPVWTHAAPRSTAGLAAADVHGHPSRALFVVGITGTNGKTTIAWLTAQLLEAVGLVPAVLGTVVNRLAGGLEVPATHTMADAPTLQRLLAQHRERGGRSVALEVSSHGLAQERDAGLELSVGVFSNLTRDHLDFHGSMEAYAGAKARMFERLGSRGVAVIHAGVDGAARMTQAARSSGARVVTYSAGSRADLCASRVRPEPGGTRLNIQGMGVADTELFLPLVGRHNVENALAALAAALLTEASPAALLQGLASVHSAPGRLQSVDTRGRPFHVYVDYAHTADGLARVLEALRESMAARGGRLICLFGCGGNRDKGKRAPMGAAVGAAADVAVLTSDNPRDEEPGAILADVLPGLAGTRARLLVEPDRRAAIALAIAEARAGDIVLLAGKGHERTQTVRGIDHPFDDAAVAAQVLA